MSDPSASRGASGLVEGFYGTPWTFAERASMVDLLAAVGLDILVVAPKDDPTHRRAWRRPLAHEARDAWARLFDHGRRAGVIVGFGINPEPDLQSQLLARERRAARRLLVERVRELRDLGVRGFSIGFDDTLPTLFSRMLTEARGREHGDLCDVVRDVCPDAHVVLVPAPYFGEPGGLDRIAGAYHRGIADRATPPPCVWTGRDVLTRWITGSEIRRLGANSGLRTVVWDNEIANDWLPIVTGERIGRGRGARVLSFGPVQNLASDVPPVADGIWLNGACEPWLTRVSARTLGDFVAAPTTYDRRASHRAALDAELGEASMAMAALHDLASYRQKAFRHAPLAIDDDEADVAAASLVESLPRLLGAHPVLDEIRPVLHRLELLARVRGGQASSRAEKRRLLRELRGAKTVLYDPRITVPRG